MASWLWFSSSERGQLPGGGGSGRAPHPNHVSLNHPPRAAAGPPHPHEPGGLDRFAAREEQYMSKESHEAKEHTSWI